MIENLPPIVRDFILNLKNTSNKDTIRYNCYTTLMNIVGEANKVIAAYEKELDKKAFRK